MRQQDELQELRISDRGRRIVMHVLGVSMMFQALLFISAIVSR